MIPLNNRHFNDRRVVCRTCHTVIDDFEPGSSRGEFRHKTTFADGKPNPCKNAGKDFDIESPEVEEFRPKRARRASARALKASTRW